MATPGGGGPSTSSMAQVTAQQYGNPAFVPDAGSSSGSRREAAFKDWKQNSGSSSGSGDVTTSIQSVKKPIPSYRAGGKLHRGRSSYFKHPYGNRLNFLDALLAGEWDEHKTPVAAPQIAPSKLVIWLTCCLFMVLIAGTIIFASESSRSSKGNTNTSSLADGVFNITVQEGS